MLWSLFSLVHLKNSHNYTRLEGLVTEVHFENSILYNRVSMFGVKIVNSRLFVSTVLALQWCSTTTFTSPHRQDLTRVTPHGTSYL